MKTLTLHNIPDALHAAIETRARQHQRSVEEEMRHMLEQVAGGATAEAAPPLLEGQVQGGKRNTLANLFDTMPPEARLSDAEAEFLNNLRYNTSPDLRWPK